MTIFLELLLVSILVGIAAAIPGNFLVLRGTSLTTFALSHSMLFGIIIFYLLTNDLNSPWLIIGAALTGVLIVWLVELLGKSQYIATDASLGMVYLFFFSLAILLITRFASSTTLSPKSVVIGNIATVPFDRISIAGIDFGPRLLWLTAIILLINILFLLIFYKELKITTFDPEYARLLGFMPTLVNLCFMTVVSLTIVIIFRVAGVILVVALMIIPPATAYLLSHRVYTMIWLSVLISIFTTTTGVFVAWKIAHVEIASVIASVSGLVFLIILLIYRYINLDTFTSRVKPKQAEGLP